MPDHVDARIQDPATEISSAATERLTHRSSSKLLPELELLFRAGRDELFEDGMESQFSRELERYIREHGKDAIHVIGHLADSGRIDPEVTAEALRLLGRIDHIPTATGRREALVGNLFASSPIVREGAALGLASLRDPSTVPALKLAIERETERPRLRRRLEQTLAHILELQQEVT